MSQELVTISTHELDRLNLIRQCVDKKMTQLVAAKTLGLSEQHLKRLVDQYVQSGPIGLVSRRRGRRSNRSYAQDIKERAISIIQEDFYGYGPTLAAEKLYEYYGIRISKETARQWMISASLLQPFKKPTPKIHLSRERRARIGELLQIDGSHHDWFEGRGPFCTLLVFIDDPTSELKKL